ncbi:hydroxyacylglutathione hydrolase cytoplasmic-like [Pyrus communis]|uniref:hydroxyacylglutathione hydrolase cytoplasmic-like n=1 Tax=Pyrus communis TaxID=23211 RepID=UPI0035BF5021
MGCRIIDESTNKAAVVDPVEPEKVLKAAQEHGVRIKLILTTRHYWGLLLGTWWCMRKFFGLSKRSEVNFPFGDSRK